MEKYIINELYADGYERIAIIESLDCSMNFIVHFLECDEYIENIAELQKTKEKEVIEGEMSVELVSVDKKAECEIMHKQTIPRSSHIEAIVQVCHVIDEYSLYVKSSICKHEIIVEFEHITNYEKGDRILIEGSLEMKEITHISD